MDVRDEAPLWQTLLAFAAVYFIWGSTPLAIRVGVLAEPPLLFAATRFMTSGLLLFGWMLLVRGGAWPTRKEWAGVAAVAALIFVGNYGLLFWAERRVPSGVASLMMSTIVLWFALGEVYLLRTRRMTARLIVALLIGVAGVGVLSFSRSVSHDAPLTWVGAVALLLSAMLFAVGSLVMRKVSLPPNRSVSAGAQMLLGGVMLLVLATVAGEWRGYSPHALSPEVWAAWLYLVFAGSMLGFASFVWLMSRESPTKVGTYAYVNPCVAVVLGHFALGEAIGWRTLLGTACVLLSVVLITTAPRLAGDS